MRKMVLGLLVLGLSGCVTPNHIRSKLDAWLDRPADELVLQYGPPTEQSSLSNGDLVYSYLFDLGSRSNAVVHGNVGRGATTSDWCRVNFVVAPDSKHIKDYRANGTFCVAKRDNSIFEPAK